jgi:hypothetical protein
LGYALFALVSRAKKINAMKKVLIISPFFPPINSADMQRIRQSLIYYNENGWNAEIVTVDPQYIDIHKDENLVQTIPNDILVHKVKAFSIKITKNFGLGSIAYRSMYQYWKYVDRLLSSNKFDLIFFSTTAYPLCALGRIWKAKHKIPYIIDMQDPWRPDHYLSLPEDKRPPKFWLSFRLDSILEKFSMAKVDGLMSVSQTYIDVLTERYKQLKLIPHAVIPFAAYKIDVEVTRSICIQNNYFDKKDGKFNIVYIGRAGYDMVLSNTLFLKAIKKGRDQFEEFKNIKIFYIGTSYDSTGKGIKTVEPIASQLGLIDCVEEFSNRIPYFQSLKILSEADFLFVPGSDNIGYTASKIYSYVWLNKPLLTLFHSSSSVNDFMNDCNAGLSLNFDTEREQVIIEKIINYIQLAYTNNHTNKINWSNFDKYTSFNTTKLQTELFHKTLN